MIAHVIPLRRTPLNLPFFDYLVPSELEGAITVGQLVSIPFRSRTEYGIVKEISKDPAFAEASAGKHGSGNKPDVKLKSINSIIVKIPIISAEHLLFLEEIAELYHVSLGFVVKSNIPEFTKKIQFDEPERTTRKNVFDKPTLLVYGTQTEKYTFLKQTLSSEGQTLILVPEIEDIQSVIDHLPSELQKTAIAFHSELKTKEYRECWLKVWNNQKKIIVGTRQALFLSFAHLHTIIVDNEGHPSHKSWDMAPRFHTRDAALSLAKYEGAKLVITTHTSTVESYYFATKGIYQTITSPLPQKPPVPYHIIDTPHERSAKNVSLLSNEVQKYIEATDGQIFLFLNKLGSASYSGCRDCGFVFTCPNCKRTYSYSEKKRLLSCSWCKHTEPAPLSCPKCTGTNLFTIGHGTEQLEKELKKQFPNRPILRIDSTNAITKIIAIPKNALIIGTQQAWTRLEWDTLKAMVFVDIDTSLFSPEYKTTEYVWQQLRDALFKLPSTAELFIQTKHIEHAVLNGITDPHNFYENELATRQLFGYPPFYFVVKLFASGATQNIIENEAKRLYYALFQLTKTHKDITITPNLEMTPSFQKGVYWQVLIAKVSYKNYKQMIREIVKLLPDNWKVDLNPNTLLSL